MVCNICGAQDATIHLTEIHNSQMMEIHLCESCAQEKGTEFKTHFNFNDLISGLGDLTPWGLETVSQPSSATCDRCGMTLEVLSKTGRLGCSSCYDVFAQAVIPLIRRVQRSTVHTGKVPQTVPSKKSASKAKDHLVDLTALQKRLRQYIEGEEFEKAAQIRDEIKKLEEKQRKPLKSPSRKSSK